MRESSRLWGFGVPAFWRLSGRSRTSKPQNFKTSTPKTPGRIFQRPDSWTTASAGRKACRTACGLDGFDADRLDTRMRRTAPERELDAIDGFLVPLDQRFDTAVWQILNVAVHPFSRRPSSGEHPESDPLHTPTDQEPPRDDHETLIISRSAVAEWQLAGRPVVRERVGEGS
jgi:hypothetical protein